MTPKADNHQQHSNSDDSSTENWLESSNVSEANKRAAVANLRDCGLLPRTPVARLVCKTSTSSFSWYSSSDDEDEETDFGDSDLDDDDEGDEDTEANPNVHGALFAVEYEATIIGFQQGSGLYGLGGGGGYDSLTAAYGRRQTEQEEKEEEEALNEAKFQRDEEVFQSNLSRRSIRFLEKPQVQEYEPAPCDCHADLYYSCHQLQKMMDDANAEHQPTLTTADE